MRTRAIIIAAAATLLAAGTAWGQDVDIQVRVVSSESRTEVSSQTFGVPKVGTYWNANVPMPYIPPRWLCVTDATAQIYPPSGAIYVRFVHDIEGHDYHSAPVNKPITTPIAFPPGDPTLLVLVNPTGERVWALVRIAGYLGREAGVERSEACR